MNPKLGIIVGALGAGYYAGVLIYYQFKWLYVFYMVVLLGVAIYFTYVKPIKK